MCIKIGMLRRNKNTPRSVVRGAPLGHEARQGVAIATADARDLPLGYALDRGERKDEAERTIYTFLPIRPTETMLQSIEYTRIYSTAMLYTKQEK